RRTRVLPMGRAPTSSDRKRLACCLASKATTRRVTFCSALPRPLLSTNTARQPLSVGCRSLSSTAILPFSAAIADHVRHCRIPSVAAKDRQIRSFFQPIDFPSPVGTARSTSSPPLCRQTDAAGNPAKCTRLTRKHARKRSVAGRLAAMPTNSARLPQPAKRRPAAAAVRQGGRGFGVQTVYDALRRDILEMTLPPGEALDETRLSRRFSMSRTPVREALVRLAAEGLVTTLPNRNTVVSTIDFSTVPVYFDALTLMYRVTTRLAAIRRSDADLAAIRALQVDFARSVGNADALAMISVNRDFHLAIARAGRNRYYTDFFARLLDEGRRLLRLYYYSYGY